MLYNKRNFFFFTSYLWNALISSSWLHRFQDTLLFYILLTEKSAALCWSVCFWEVITWSTSFHGSKYKVGTMTSVLFLFMGVVMNSSQWKWEQRVPLQWAVPAPGSSLGPAHPRGWAPAGRTIHNFWLTCRNIARLDLLLQLGNSLFLPMVPEAWKHQAA